MEIVNGQLDTTSSTVITAKPTLSVNLAEKHVNAPEKKEISMDNKGGMFEFTTSFTCLGSALTFLLDDTIDVKCRMSKAPKVMGALKDVWDAREVPLSSKVKLHQAIPINLLSWGRNNWSVNQNDTQLLEAFHHKSIRRILGINMTRVMDKEIKNSTIRRWFDNIEEIKDVWRRRQSLFLGRIARFQSTKHPPTILVATNLGKR